MPQKWSLKIILLFYCFISPICEGQECGSDSTINNYDYGTEYENDYEPFSCPCDNYPCENEGSCSNLNTTSYVCKCQPGYEGENCEKNICDDLPSANVYQCETSAGDPICIRTDKICNGNATHKNEDCPNGEDELRCVDDDYTTCVGPVRWCDAIEDCEVHGNNNDENDCCIDGSELETTCSAEDEILDECRNECVPKCDGKNDTCVKLHGASAQNTTCIEYSDLDEQGCEISCANGKDIQCFNVNNNPLPLICLSPDKKCDGIRDCKTFGEDEVNCKKPCDSNPCKNEAKCVNENFEEYTCNCSKGFFGKNCTVAPYPCEPNPCQNSAECINESFEDYKCKCLLGFSGKNCDISTVNPENEIADPCLSDPCKNSAVCKNDNFVDYQCKCLSGFSGKNCDIENECKDPWWFCDNRWLWFILVVVVIILLVLLCAIFWRRRNTRKYILEQSNNAKSNGAIHLPVVEETSKLKTPHPKSSQTPPASIKTESDLSPDMSSSIPSSDTPPSPELLLVPQVKPLSWEEYARSLPRKKDVKITPGPDSMFGKPQPLKVVPKVGFNDANQKIDVVEWVKTNDKP